MRDAFVFGEMSVAGEFTRTQGLALAAMMAADLERLRQRGEWVLGGSWAAVE